MSDRGTWLKAPEIGQKIVCIDKGHPRITYGKIYIVENIQSSNCIGLIADDKQEGGFFWRRFVPYSTEGSCLLCSSKCKKDKPCSLSDFIEVKE